MSHACKLPALTLHNPILIAVFIKLTSLLICSTQYNYWALKLPLKIATYFLCTLGNWCVLDLHIFDSLQLIPLQNIHLHLYCPLKWFFIRREPKWFDALLTSFYEKKCCCYILDLCQLQFFALSLTVINFHSQSETDFASFSNLITDI